MHITIKDEPQMPKSVLSWPLFDDVYVKAVYVRRLICRDAASVVNQYAYTYEVKSLDDSIDEIVSLAAHKCNTWDLHYVADDMCGDVEIIFDHTLNISTDVLCAYIASITTETYKILCTVKSYRYQICVNSDSGVEHIFVIDIFKQDNAGRRSIAYIN